MPHRIFGNTYDFFMYFLERRFLRARRKRLLSGLTGKILEVGVGTGVNFEHYNPDIEVTGIDPSPYMIPQAEKKRALLLLPNRITLFNIGCGYPEMEKKIVPLSLDAVVCTLVLCTIPNPEKALVNFKKWLKPGGRLVILEHIRSHRKIAGKLQDIFNPVWEKVTEGCQLNRSTDQLLMFSGFRLLREERFNIGIPFYEAEYEKPQSKDE